MVLKPTEISPQDIFKLLPKQTGAWAQHGTVVTGLLAVVYAMTFRTMLIVLTFFSTPASFSVFIFLFVHLIVVAKTKRRQLKMLLFI